MSTEDIGKDAVHQRILLLDDQRFNGYVTISV